MLRQIPKIIVIALGVLTVAACGGGGTPSPTPEASGIKINFVGNSSCPTNNAQQYYTEAPPTNGSPVGQPIDEMPHTHLNPPASVTYLHDPPTSGCHYNLGLGQAPIAPGVYNQAIPPEYWIHNLEHGYVAVLYNCPSGCDSDFNTIKQWADNQPVDSACNSTWQGNNPPITPFARLIVLQETTMKVKFAAVAWDWYLGMDKLDINQIGAFFQNHVGLGPESSC